MKEIRKNRTLDQISRKGEFICPEGYFEKMALEITEKTKLEENKNVGVSTKVVQLKKGSKKSFYYIAAAACLFIGLVLYNNTGIEKEDCQTFACLLESTEINSSDIENLEQDDISDFLDDDYNEEFLNL